MPRRERPPLPLRHRLPNAPARLLGREAELERFVGAVNRAPLAWVTGFGGLGKSALVLTAMERAFAANRAQVVALRVLSGEALADALLRAAGVLATVRGLTLTNPPDAADDTVALLLDLAEGRGLRGRRGPSYWLLLEDLHHAADPNVELLASFAEHARDSRLLITSRTPLRVPSLPGQGVTLQPLSLASLCELARLWDPAAPDERIREWAERSAGSPWRLQQLVAGAKPGLQPGELDWLSGISLEVRRGIVSLSLLQVELSHEATQDLPVALDAREIEALSRRGILERSAHTVRLHDVARQTVLGAVGSAEQQQVAHELGRALREATDPLLQLEGLRLALMAEPDAAPRWIEDHGADWIAAGLAPRVWQILSDEASPKLMSYRLELAVALGNSHALERVTLPEAPTLRDRERFASVLLQRGRLEEARQEAENLIAQIEPGEHPELYQDALRIVARSHLQSDDAQAAWQVLTERFQGPRAALHELDRAIVAVRLDRVAEALDIAAKLEPQIATAKALDAARLRYGLAWIYYWTGKLADAARVFDRGLQSRALYEHETARRVLLRSGIELGRANLTEAQRWVDRASLLTGRDPATRAYFRMIEATVALESGDFARTSGTLKALSREQLLPTIRRGTFVLEVRLAIETGPGEDTLPHPGELPGDAGPFDRELFAWWALYRLHRGDRSAFLALPTSLPPWVLAEVRVLGEILESRDRLLSGQPSEALAAASRARLAAQPDGHAMLEIHSLRAALDAALVLHGPRSDERLAWARELHAAAERASSDPPMADALWHLAIVAPAAACASRLEALVDRPGVAGRRARALLGLESRLDALDAVVVGAAERALGFRIRHVCGPSDPVQGVGLDSGSWSLWTPDAVTDLSERLLLFGLLDCIASLGGRATKEQLLLSVWRETDYHPLRHDAKLYSAVSALRQLLPARYAKLVRPEGAGYALDPKVPVRRSEPIP